MGLWLLILIKNKKNLFDFILFVVSLIIRLFLNTKFLFMRIFVWENIYEIVLVKHDKLRTTTIYEEVSENL